MMQLTRSIAAAFDLSELGRHHWQAHIDGTWRGWSGPHGGVIAALTVEAARRTVGEEFPVRACDLHFLGRPGIGALTLHAEHHPVGRSSHVVDVRVHQDDRTIAAATITLGRNGDTTVAARAGRPVPAVPRPEACARFHLPAEIVPAGGHFDIRPAAGPLPLTGSEEAWMTAWIAVTPVADTALPIDAATLAVLADALPPGIFPTLTVPVPVPTVTLSMHLHTDEFDAGTRFALVRAANAGTGGGWSIDETDIWDEHGRLLATARQSRRVLG
ncbi:thioesterase family protein [Nocardia higoensis]|uniref:thioesterase family protein n=1 Tax=Nocardia higoensis TaxID=228599 RepID=UPI00059530C9|nr:thioesterase family protein [Nocardia higoensis]